MARRKDIRSKLQYQRGLELEKTDDHPGAIKAYQKAVDTDPGNIRAWNRQMILFRRSKTKSQEITLIKTAIAEYKKAVQANHQTWLKENREKAASSLELATVLGLIEPNGTPRNDQTILGKWETRLYLLEYRLKNARPKKTKPAALATKARSSKKNQTKIARPKPHTAAKPKATAIEKTRQRKTDK